MKLVDYLSLAGQDAASFATAMGVTTKAVSHWISGERTPRQAQMQKIVDLTNGAVTPNDFLPFRREASSEEVSVNL